MREENANVQKKEGCRLMDRVKISIHRKNSNGHDAARKQDWVYTINRDNINQNEIDGQNNARWVISED